VVDLDDLLHLPHRLLPARVSAIIVGACGCKPECATVRSTVERTRSPVNAWFAVMTKPRSEAVAEANLRRQGFDCLFPRVVRALRGATGLKDRIEPLFPGYLFLLADTECNSLAPIRSTRGAIGLVRFGMEPARVAHDVIARIVSRINAEDGLVRLDTPTLEPGSSVRVTTGPLSGWEGIFLAGEGSDRVRLLLDMLGSVREVVLPREQLAMRI